MELVLLMAMRVKFHILLTIPICFGVILVMMDGEGENCGKIVVNNNITVFAYGGSGGEKGGRGLNSTGGGREWISSCSE